MGPLDSHDHLHFQPVIPGTAASVVEAMDATLMDTSDRPGGRVFR